ncbi:MAG TPA: fructosamine kinase family protein [Gammaproteobacteria bacterium]|nr:fructosamine kinase family protein [Gammaproteobacteria bacterium]
MRSGDWQARVEGTLEAVAPVRRRPEWHALGEGVGGARWRLRWGEDSWFVKRGEAEILAAEADGLKALAAAAALRVPAVIACGADGDAGYLVLEWLTLGRKSVAAGAGLGEALARQHLQTVEGFGWPRHNFIGATPQFNTASRDWTAFFREQRLNFQLRLAAESGYRGALQERGAELAAELAHLFNGYGPQPALLHGDLWGGNWGSVVDGGPVVFDPAVYRGDREADLAMTELFGGFDAEFYAAYRMHAPLDAGYAVRRDLYQLYHVLNHLNLFGGAYHGQALSLMRRLLANLR